MRHRRRTRELNRLQLTVPYFLEPQNKIEEEMFDKPDYFAELYPHMLIEDVTLHLMPVPRYSRNESFRIHLVPPDPGVEEIVSEAIDRQGRSGDITTATYYFFHECAQSLMTHNKSVYEIVLLADPERGSTVGFLLAFVDPLTLIYKRGKTYQYIPEKIAKERGVTGEIELPPERLLVFDPPKRVRGRTGEMLRSLSAIGKHLLPDFAMPSMAGGEKRIPFDYSDFRRAEMLSLADTVKDIGWNARESLQDHTLEYYRMHRSLLFERFVIEMRNGILAILNEGIARAGQKLDFSAKIEIEGLATLEDVDIAQSHLEIGDQAFEEIMKKFWS